MRTASVGRKPEYFAFFSVTTTFRRTTNTPSSDRSATAWGSAWLLVLALSLWPPLAPFASAADNGAGARAQSLTQALTGLNQAYRQAAPTARTRAMNDLLSLARERRALLAELMASDPGAVLDAALPEETRRALPAQVQALLEQPVAVEGEIEVLYEDYADGHARLLHFLKVFDERFALHFRAAPPGLLSGTAVKASGVQLDTAMALESGASILTLAAGGGAQDGSNGGTPAAVPGTLGEQRTLVMLVNFEDQRAEPYTIADAEDRVFSRVSDFLLESSYGQTWLVGEVVGWLTIPLTSTVCDSTTLASQADSAAQAAGANLSAYTRLVYFFQNACGGKGIGTVGGNPSRAWIIGELDTQVVAHELGHGLGLWHAKSLDCGATTLGSSCTVFAYGDPFDAMGNTALGHYSAFQKERLGWLGAGVSPPITTVTGSGTYSLAPLESDDPRAKALKILKSTDPSTGERTWYYLEFRQAIGFDGFLAGNANVLDGVLVHTASESTGDSSFLLDMTPASGLLNFQDWADPALTTGERFEDSDAGVILTTDWVSGTEAAVNVLFAPGSIDQPTLTLATGQTSYARGQTVSLVAEVTTRGAPVVGATVSFTISKSNGAAVSGSATTGADGIALYRLRLRKQDPIGAYQAAAISSADGIRVAGATAFTVQ